MTHAEAIPTPARLHAHGSPLSRWLRAARLILARDGVGALARRGVRRLWLRERYLVYVRPLVDEAGHTSPPGPVSVRRASAPERADLARCTDDLGAAQYWDVLDPGAECYLGWDGDRIVAVHWVSTTHETNGLVTLEPGDCVIGPCVTTPAYRGRGIYPMMLSAICRDRRTQGQRRAYMVVNVDNHASVRGIEKAGFRQTQRMTLTRVLGWQRVGAVPAWEGDS
jgi:GNAT superfamily N-acetyltransferase